MRFRNQTKGTNMNIEKFLKIYSSEGVIFEPLNSDMQEANVESVYDIKEVVGVGQKVEGQWQVKEV